MSPWTQTYDGQYFNFEKPAKYDYKIAVIARALSNICRFNGHCLEFYSVAQHSVLVSQLVTQKWALHGLLHDAAEAFVGDMVSGLKLLNPSFGEIEQRVSESLFEQFASELEPLTDKGRIAIKWADLTALAVERRDLMPADDPTNDNQHWDLIDGVDVSSVARISGELPEIAHQNFLKRYLELVPPI